MVVLKKGVKVVFVIALALYILFSISMQLELNKDKKDSIQHNYKKLNYIISIGDNLSNRLELFLTLVNETSKKTELHMKLADNWRIVMGESKQIYAQLNFLNNRYLEPDDAFNLSLLQLSLSRVDGYITQLTNKYLEQQEFAINNEEEEKLQAIVNLYKAMAAYSIDENIDLASILKTIEPYMMEIDENYELLLERSSHS